MRPKRSPLAYPLPPGSTRVGNGSALLEGIDGRTSGARRYRELTSELCLELTHMKRHPTSTEILLLRRAAMLIMWCERTEAEMAGGKAVDITAYTAATNTLRRILTDAGVVEART